jgi:ribosomal protein S18 acetylase RimI-like enzyme
VSVEPPRLVRPLAVQPRHDLSPGETDALEQHLYAFNQQRTGYLDGRGLAFVAEAGDDLVGAVAGYTWGGICELRQVWVHEASRGSGVGRTLMQAAVAEARARGCAHVFLTTYDFQAPEFYRRLGFAEAARIPDKPLGHTEFVMRLDLADG